MKNGWITFAGAGPGAIDLLTIRCRDAIAEADVVLYAGSLINPDILQFARPDCEKHDSAGLTLPRIVDLMVSAARAGQKVLRLHTGDPSVYGAIAEQMEALDNAGISYEIIPGVSAAFAAAAAVKAELTVPGISQTVVFGRRAGRTPVPEGQDLISLARHHATMILYLSVADIEAVVGDVLNGGYAKETPVAVVYRATWPDEKIISGTLADIAGKVRGSGIGKHAIILIGESLRGVGEKSKLYDPSFFHGYRGEVADFHGNIAVYALTEKGCELAARAGKAMGATVFLSQKHGHPKRHDNSIRLFDPTTLREIIEDNWTFFDGHVFVMACGIVVRRIASLLFDKTTDPAVVVCDEAGRFAVSLVGGHIAGANRLAGTVARTLGASAVVTTATDVQGLMAFDEFAERQGCQILNPENIKVLNSFLLQGKRIGIICREDFCCDVYSRYSHVVRMASTDPIAPEMEGLVVIDCNALNIFKPIPVLYVQSKPIVLGVGCRRNATSDEILAAVDATLKHHAIDSRRIRAVGSLGIKKEEPGLIQAMKERSWPLKFFDAEDLASVRVPNPSDSVQEAAGCPSVAEAAALLLGQGRLLVPKQKCRTVTVAVATDERAEMPGKTGCIYAVGIGPGTREGMTQHALRVIREANIVVGYSRYCKQIEWLTHGKRVIASGMRAEIARCDTAIDEALRGKAVALVSSGDAGIYGMAGLLFERLASRGVDGIDVEIVPGITAASLAAAAVGAPLSNDFAAVSLSDLLTDRETVLRRIKCVAESGIACVLYNPRSKARKELLDHVIEIFKEARGGSITAAIVSHAGRANQTQWVGYISDIPVARVDMSSVVIIGSEETFISKGKMVTQRGYRTKTESRED